MSRIHNQIWPQNLRRKIIMTSAALKEGVDSRRAKVGEVSGGIYIKKVDESGASHFRCARVSFSDRSPGRDRGEELSFSRQSTRTI